MFFPGRATACARLLEVHQRKCVIGHGLFDGEGNCTAVLKAIMVSLNEETQERDKTPGKAAVAATLILLATYLLTTVAALPGIFLYWWMLRSGLAEDSIAEPDIKAAAAGS